MIKQPALFVHCRRFGTSLKPQIHTSSVVLHVLMCEGLPGRPQNRVLLKDPSMIALWYEPSVDGPASPEPGLHSTESMRIAGTDKALNMQGAGVVYFLE